MKDTTRLKYGKYFFRATHGVGYESRAVTARFAGHCARCSLVLTVQDSRCPRCDEPTLPPEVLDAHIPA